MASLAGCVDGAGWSQNLKGGGASFFGFPFEKARRKILLCGSC